MTLGEMLVREAIRYTISRYNSAVDRGTYEELADVFAPDGVMMFGDKIRLEGLESIIATMSAGAKGRNADDPSKFQRHLLGNPIINVIDDKTARAVTYLVVISELGLDHSGVYVDRFVKAGDRWLISERVGHLEWGHPASRFIKTIAPKPAARAALDVRFRALEG